MKNRLKIHEIGFTELSESSRRETLGGFWLFIPQALLAALFISFINNIQDVHQGLMDGYHGTPRYGNTN